MGIRACRAYPVVITNQEPSISLPAQMINSSRVVETFESSAGYSNSGGTIANNTDQKLYGNQSVKFTTPSGSSFYCYKTISENFANDQSFRFCIYLHDANLEFLQIRISSDVTITKRFQFIFYPTGLNAVVPGWNIINVDKSDFTNVSGDSWDNTMIRLYISPDPVAGQVTSVSLDNFSVVAARPAALLTFDDGGATVFTQGHSYMRQKQVVGTSYIISSLIDDVPHTYMTSAQLVELNQAGWDVANHSDDGDSLVGQAQADVQTSLAACKTFLDGLGLTRASAHVAYPGGNYDATVLAAMAAESMLTGRGTGDRYRPVLPSGDLYQLQLTKLLNNTCSLAQAKAVIDAAVTEKEICSFLCHGLAASASATNWAIADFQALIDYIRQVQIQTLTISEYYRLNSGAITVNHY